MTTPGDSNANNRVRKHVTYRGQVQGVFFRATTRETARNFPVSGYVRNLPDGTVELEAEGSEDVVDHFLRDVERQYADNITGKDIQQRPVTGETGGFEIRY